MNSLFWERAHGGLTHFPIALIFVATLFDVLSVLSKQKEKRQGFQTIGYWLMILAAVGAVGAVLSGLMLSKGQVVGTGLVRLHHLFVWPAFVLVVGLAAWRIFSGNQFSRRTFASYLVTACAGCALIGAGGFVGGEMLLGENQSTTNSAPASPAEIAEGRHLFVMNCAHCHGDDAHGDEGPDLYNLHKSDAHIHQVVTGGIKGEMPSFGKKFGEPEVRQLTAYIRTLRS